MMGQVFTLNGQRYITQDTSVGTMNTIRAHTGSISQLVKLLPNANIQQISNNGLTVVVTKAS